MNRGLDEKRRGKHGNGRKEKTIERNLGVSRESLMTGGEWENETKVQEVEIISVPKNESLDRSELSQVHLDQTQRLVAFPSGQTLMSDLHSTKCH